MRHRIASLSMKSQKLLSLNFFCERFQTFFGEVLAEKDGENHVQETSVQKHPLLLIRFFYSGE